MVQLAQTQTVLIVDDEAALRELMRVSLGPRYRYLEAEDGEQALALVREQAPDLLLLDLMLPRLSGLELLARVRAEPRLAAIAVIVVTAQPALLDEARALGADELLSKPFEPEQLAAAAEALLASRRGRDAA